MAHPIHLLQFAPTRFNCSTIVFVDIDVKFAADEMLEAEGREFGGRLADLERRVIEQGDDLVCLRATLAEVLRRLNQLEGPRLAQNHQTQHGPQPSGPARNGFSREVRIRQPTYSSST